MKRSILRLITTVAVLGLTQATQAIAQGRSYPSRPGEVIIQFRGNAPQRERNAILSDLGATNVKNLNAAGVKHARIVTLGTEEAIARYRNHPRVQFIEPNYIIEASRDPNDTRFPDQWALRNTGQSGGIPGADVDATIVWDTFTGSRDVVIAITDTGLDFGHPDLSPNVFVNQGEIPNNGVDDDGNGFVDDVRGWDFVNGDNDPSDDAGHGTHVAGISGAVGNNGAGIAGLNWDVQLLPIKFLDAFGFGTTADAVSSVHYAVMMGATVINASWGGGGPSEALRLAIVAAEQAGILFVAAAGNDGTDTDIFPHYPSSYDVDNIISVAGTDHADRLASWSNYGASSVDLAAPGDAILSTVPPSTYALNSGTSMASPYVAGAVALIYGRFPSIAARDAKALLLNSVDAVPGLAGRVATGGRLNAWMPIAEPDSIAPSPVVDLQALDPNGTRVTLRWTATGDDSTSGRASRYEVRYSTSPIDDVNFDAAMLASNAPFPLISGSPEEMQVTGLEFSTPYHFAVKVFDEFGNASGISNVDTETTLGPPDIAVSPGALNAALLSGQTTTRILTLTNSGASDLNFDIDFAVVSEVTDPSERPGPDISRTFKIGSTPLDPATATPYPPSDVSYDSGSSQRRDAIGPNAIRRTSLQSGSLRILLLHSGADVSEIQNLLASFVDVETADVFDGTTSAPTLGDLVTYHCVFVVSNTAFGDPVAVGDVLADYADTGGGVVLTLASFIAGWEIQGRFLAEGYNPFTLGAGPIGSSSLSAFDAAHPIMADVANATGDLLGDVDLAAGSALVASWLNGEPFVATNDRRIVAVNIFLGSTGNWTGDVPLLLRNAAAWSSGAVSWLTSDPPSGVVPAGSQLGLVLTVDATELTGGDYVSDLVVTSDDPDESQVFVRVDLQVTGVPDISVVGSEVVEESTVDYTMAGALTTHTLDLGAAPAAGGTLELLANGDFGAPSETATATVEGTVVGSAGAVGSDCVPVDATFVLDAATMAELSADGRVDIVVQNSVDVDVFCVTNQHTVRLRYPLSADLLDFGPVFVGVGAELAVTVINRGTDVLELSSVTTDAADFIPEVASLTLAPNASSRVVVRFRPSTGGVFGGTLTLVSNDPDTPIFTVPLAGTGLLPPVVDVQPTALTSVLFEGAQETQVLSISNTGQSALDFSLQIVPGVPGAVVSTFAGLSPAVHDTGNPPPQTSANVEPAGLSGAEPDFLAATGEFEALRSSPVPMTCVVEDRSANVLYAQQNQGNAFYRYVASTDTWEVLAAAPIHSGNNGGAALLNGKIYTSYADGSFPMGVYDIAVDSWSTLPHPIGQGTANIASDGQQYLYLVNGFQLVRLDPVSGANTNLATAPFFFEAWGGFRHLDGDLYGHQGNGTSGFANYDIATNTWTVLPNVPGGAVLGAAIDPVTLEYVAYGSYGGNSLYRYSIPGGAWTVLTIPFFSVEDGGLGWLAGPVPGIYFVQGESGTGLARTVGQPIFLTVTPDAGSLPPSGSVDIDVRFDTSNLLGGQDYPANIKIVSNDPITPEVRVPAILTVVGVPDIAVAGDVTSLDFGQVFVGLSPELALTILNRGSDALEVQSITTDLPEFLPEVGSLTIGPRSGQRLAIAFTPSSARAFDGNLVLQSNDPDEPQITIALHGEGLVPPDIGLSPTSLDVELFTGEMSQQMVTISNTGGSDLTFDLRVQGAMPSKVSMRLRSAASMRSRRAVTAALPGLGPAMSAPTGIGFDAGSTRLSTETNTGPLRSDQAPEGYMPIPVGFSTMANATALIIQDVAPWGTLSNEHVLSENAIAFDMIPSGALTTADLLQYSLVIVPGDQPTSYYSQLSAASAQLNHFVSSGGVLEFHAAGWGFSAGDASIVTLPEGMQIRYHSSPLNTVLDPSHALMVGIPSPFGSSASHAYFSNVPLNAALVASDDQGRANLVTYASGRGHVIAGCQTFEFGYANAFDTGSVLQNMIPFAHATDASWLSVSQSSGTVPSGSTLEIVATFDATGLNGGDYNGSVVVTSNDPDEPTLEVSTHMQVTGAPDIVVRGARVDVESTQTYTVSGASTIHTLPTDGEPAGDGTLELVAEGDYGDATETATVTAEGLRLGEVGRVGSDCLTASDSFSIAAADLTNLLADGVVDVQVQNSSNVDVFCAENRHTVRLHYRRFADALDFGSLFLGLCRSLSFEVSNVGTDVLTVHEILSGHGSVTVDVTSFTLAPGESQAVTATFCPTSAGAFSSDLTLSSDDPDQPQTRIVLEGEGLVPPDIGLSPTSLNADLFTGEVSQQVVTITNTGGSDLTFDLGLRGDLPSKVAMQLHSRGGLERRIRPATAGQRQTPGIAVAAQPRDAPHERPVRVSMEPDPGPGRSDQVPEDYTPIPVGFSAMDHATALIIQDVAPWGTLSNEQVLSANGIAFDMIPASAVATTDLSAYSQVIVPSDQPTFYYSQLSAASNQLNDYVSGGGVLEFHAAGWGFSAGDASIVTLPEGMQINHYASGSNAVLDLSHPLTAGVPNPFVGNAVSHAYFSSVPDDATLIASDDQGRVNLVVYGSGSGLVIAACQTLEFGYANSQHAGQILQNMIPFAHAATPSWLSADPQSATVPAGATLDLVVTFDAAGLNGGDYNGSVVVNSNDPDEPTLEVSAHMHVTGAADLLIRGERVDVESTATYATSGASTSHTLPTDVEPAGGGTLELVAEGDYGDISETATVTAEGLRLGDVGRVGSDCLTASGSFAIAAADLIGLLSDGVVDVQVQNSSSVDVFCDENSHTVRLRYRSPADVLDFGSLFIGLCRSLSFEVSNIGTDVLTVSGISSGQGDVTADVTNFTLAPGESREVTATFCPTRAGVLSDDLTLSSNDPDRPQTTIALAGEGLVPPEIAVAPSALNEDLLVGRMSTHLLRIANGGGSALNFTLSLQVAPAEAVATKVGASGPDAHRIKDTGMRRLNPEIYRQRYAAFANDNTPVAPASRRRGLQKATRVGVPPRLDTTTIFFDDMESGVNGWSHASTHANGIDQWAQSTSRASSGSTSWNVSQHASFGSDALQTPPISLTGYIQAALSFNHWYQFDDCSGNPTFEPDGGIVEVSSDDGATWQQISPVGGYPYVLDDICDNPLAFRDAYSHNSSSVFTPALFDLTPFVGNTVLIRFHAGWDCGNCGANEGWFVDDVLVSSETPQWISLSPVEGSVAPQASLDVSVAFDATALDVGSYDAIIVISSNDLDDATVIVPVNLEVFDVSADLDVNPETLNLGRQGNFVTAYLQAPVGFDPVDVVVPSVRLNRDAAPDPEKVSIGDDDHDGIPEITLKFGMTDVRQTLHEGDSVRIVATGELAGGRRFLAEDSIRVIRHGVDVPNGGEFLGFGQSFVIRWNVPDDWTPSHADLYHSLDGGISWQLIADHVGDTSFSWSVPTVASEKALIRVYLFDNMGMIAYDSSNETFTIQESTTDVVGDGRMDIRLSLQSAPNPFRSGTSTAIAFYLPTSANVSLKVYDVSGRLVRTLHQGSMPAGRHLVSWDGRGEGLRQVAAGIYFCNLRTRDATLTRRMVLLR